MNSLVRRVYPSLGVSAYRIVWIGMVPSLLAFHMGVVAAGYAAVTLTESAFLVGLIGGAWGIPLALIPLVGGAIADSGSRRRIMVITHTAVSASAAAVGALFFAGWLSWWFLVIHGLVIGVTLSFLTPARIAYSIDAVGPDLAANTQAAFFFMSHVIGFVGPGIAGVLLGLSAVGIGWSYLLIGVLYGAAALVHSRLPYGSRGTVSVTSTWGQVRSGMKFVKSNRPLPRLIGITALIAAGGMAYIYVLPVFTDRTLDGGPEELGLLVAASGMGGLLGSIAGSVFKKRRQLWLPQKLSVFGIGIGLIAFATTTTFWPAAIWVSVIGFGTAIALIANSSLLVTHVEAGEYRGRLASLYQIPFAFGPVGAIPIGALADGIGPNAAMAAIGVAVLAVAALLTRGSTLASP
jgi:MFS family permease